MASDWQAKKTASPTPASCFFALVFEFAVLPVLPRIATNWTGVANVALFGKGGGREFGPDGVGGSFDFGSRSGERGSIVGLREVMNSPNALEYSFE